MNMLLIYFCCSTVVFNVTVEVVYSSNETVACEYVCVNLLHAIMKSNSLWPEYMANNTYYDLLYQHRDGAPNLER